jgi:hypothetical protein
VTPLLRRSGELLPDPTSARAAGRVGLPPALAVSHQKGFAKLRQENRCRMCQRPASVRPLTRHHVVPRSWFKERPKLACLQHADANIVPLCAPCHSDVERPGDHARIELRRLLRPGELAFALRTAGRRWLDRRYPANSRQLESAWNQQPRSCSTVVASARTARASFTPATARPACASPPAPSGSRAAHSPPSARNPVKSFLRAGTSRVIPLQTGAPSYQPNMATW